MFVLLKVGQEQFAAQLLQEMTSPSGASMKAVESAEQTINTARQIRNYSQSLRQSSAMQKYLQSSDGGKTKEARDTIDRNTNNRDPYYGIQQRPTAEKDYKPHRAPSSAPVRTTQQSQISQDESFTLKKITNTILSRNAQQEKSGNDHQDERFDTLFDAKEAQKKFTRENNSAADTDVSKDSVGSTALFRARLLSK